MTREKVQSGRDAIRPRVVRLLFRIWGADPDPGKPALFRRLPPKNGPKSCPDAERNRGALPKALASPYVSRLDCYPKGFGGLPVRFIHTADWQIGAVFRFVAPEKMALLQQARLDAITRLGTAAVERNAPHVLVAGDVFDLEGLSDRTLAQPVERMRAFPTVNWHLLPGNHDAHRPDGLWDRLRRRGVPENVHLHLASEPFAIGETAVLLPCPALRRHTMQDVSLWTETATSAPGVLRIGMAHGSIREFGSEGDQTNYIPPDRATRSGLDWLALGDWHGMLQVDARTAYSGTPEIDSFDVVDGGTALLVEIAGSGAVPVVERLETGRYVWRRHEATLAGEADIRALEAMIDGFGARASETLLRLSVRGALSYADLELFDRAVRRRGDAALFDLALDDAALIAAPTEEDLRALDVQGPVGSVAARLKAMSEEGDPEKRALAQAALRRLFIEYRLAEGQA